MKNPFKEKEDHTGLIVGIAIGVAAGISLGWLLLTQRGIMYRRQISRRFEEGISDKTANVISKKTIVSKNLAKAASDAVIKNK